VHEHDSRIRPMLYLHSDNWRYTCRRDEDSNFRYHFYTISLALGRSGRMRFDIPDKPRFVRRRQLCLQL